MAKPPSVQELRRQLDIPLEDILLLCNFCQAFLTFEELLQFDAKNLNLIWKDNYAYACCCACAKQVAAIEATYFYEYSVQGKDAIERESGSLLCCLTVRCKCCLRHLDYLEKLAVCASGIPFDKVRGAWKAVCRFCTEI